MHVGQAAGLLQHLQAPAQRALAHVLLLGEDREHLEGHAAGPQLRQPEVAERVGDAPLALVQDTQQQVVVAVRHRQRRHHHQEVVPALLASRRRASCARETAMTSAPP